MRVMNLLRAASVVSLLTLASRVTGLVREVLMASAFGAGAWADAFNVAFRIPNLLRRLFAEGAFSQAFVPILTAARARDGDEATQSLVDAVATVLFWVLLVTSIIGVAAAPVLVWMMASGLKEFDAATQLTRLMFPYIACMSMVALSAGILNTWKHFAVPAATPVLLNVVFIASVIWLAPSFRAWGIEPIYAVGVGVMVGGILQLAIQIPALRRVGMLPHIALSVGGIRRQFAHPAVGNVLKLMAPALLGVSVAQLSLLINTQIASHVGVGAVSWLSYADRLMEFPTALLGVALGVVLVPQLAAAQGRGDEAAYSELLDWGLRLLLMLAFPCSLALLVFPEPLVAVLYHRNAFGAEDVQQTVYALMGYGAGLMGLVGVKVLAPGFYARQDIKTPVKIALVSLVLTQLMNIAFVPFLQHAGLALSIGLAAVFNAAWLLLGLRKRGLYRPSPGWLAFGWRVMLATGVLTALMSWAARGIDWVALGARDGLRALLLAAVLTGLMAVYFGVLYALGIRPRDFARRG